MQKVWQLLDEADVVVGHNLKKFDLKKINSRFIYHGMPPPSPYKVFDTLTAARAVMANNSNKLDDIGRDYNLGRKLAHTGFHLWQGCMRGDMKSWRLMIKYCNQDVLLDYKFYKLIRPWTAHPNLNLVHGRPKGCPTCYSTHIQSRGERPQYTTGRSVRMYVCMDCGKRIKGESERLISKVVHKWKENWTNSKSDSSGRTLKMQESWKKFTYGIAAAFVVHPLKHRKTQFSMSNCIAIAICCLYMKRVSHKGHKAKLCPRTTPNERQSHVRSAIWWPKSS